jgi:hypothetical protein
MHQAPLTQAVIDHGFSKSADKSGRRKLAMHPLLVGGALLAGSGIVLATAKLAHKRNDQTGNTVRRHGSQGH